MQAYVMVHVEAGRLAEATAAIRRIPKVSRADAVSGPYDIIVNAEAEHHGDLVRDVLDPIRATRGVIRTVTCPVASHAPIWEIEFKPALVAW
jgi:DNA-binding Lrp family transcriptional regulator